MLERLDRFREGKPLPDVEAVQPPSHQEDDDAKSDIKSEERNIQMRELLTKWCRMVPSNQYRLHTQPSLENWNLRRKDTIW